MIYHSVNDRIAISFKSLQLPIPKRKTLTILKEQGFLPLSVNITATARKLVGHSIYLRGAKPAQAPKVVDCSSMVKWLYSQTGIWLPRYSIDQRDYGEPVTQPQEGDLIFASGWRSYYWTNPADNVGHVGIVTNAGTIIHAANKRLGVIESAWNDFFNRTEKSRGLRRYITEREDFRVLQMTKRRVETSQELRWIVLQRL